MKETLKALRNGWACALALILVLPLGALAASPDAKPQAKAQAGMSRDVDEQEFPFFLESAPFRELASLQNEMDKVFERFFSRFDREWAGQPGLVSLKMDVVDKGDKIIVTTDVPGLGKDDIRIGVKNNVLTISGERKAEKTVTGDAGKVISNERSFGTFTRSMLLPQGSDISKIQASCKDGILQIVIPRKGGTEPGVTTIPVS